MKIEIDKPVVPKWFDDWYKTFYLDKNQALYHISRTGWGYPLTDGEGIEVEGGFGKLRDLSDSDCYGYEDAQEYLSKAILLGYEVEQEPRYYAKIKGWEHIGTSSYYFGYDEDNDSLEVTYLESNYRFAFSLTKEHWNKLGINGMNSDFEKVD